jgi:serine/threonine-protein kinase
MAQPNQLLNNHYELLQQLGQGGFATVYKARDNWQNNRFCAIKENQQLDQIAVAQFIREAKLLRRLAHPSLPKVYDDFVDVSGKRYIVMEYIEGNNLEELVKQQGALPETQVLDAMIQICDALTYMHRNHIIHRDIKHSNIVIDSAGRAVLVDFGIAKEYDPNRPTTISARAVTPGFAPNEQYHGGTDERSDIYAMGATLYFCLTGRVPPEATSRADPSQPIQLTPPRQINAGISLMMERVILKAMEMPMNARYQTADKLRAALRSVHQGAQQLFGTINLPRWIFSPDAYSPGYSRKGYAFHLTTANGVVLCELTGFMFPLTLLQGARVRVEGKMDANNVFHVEHLTDLQMSKTWSPKSTLGRWEQLKIDLGLMNP